MQLSNKVPLNSIPSTTHTPHHKDSKARLPGFEARVYHLPAMGPWVRYLTPYVSLTWAIK